MIGSTETKLYQEQGYCFGKNLIPVDVTAAVRTRVHEMLENRPDWAEKSWQDIDPARARNSKGQPYPIGIQRPEAFEEVFRTMAHHPNLAAAMSQVLGGEVRLFTDQIGVKHGFLNEEQGGRTYYHQDSYYWKIDPALGCNVWIPLDVVGKDAITLAVKPGSQKGWKLEEHEGYFDDPKPGKVEGQHFTPFKRWRIPAAKVDASDEILFPMNPGDGLFFSNYTWHRSEPNRTGKTLLFYAIAYKLTDKAIEERNKRLGVK